MKTRTIFVIVLLATLTLTFMSCGAKPELIEIESEPYDVELVPVLELGWGNGDYEVGYINDEFRPSVEAGNIEVGPIAFYVDGEESIYIDDSMNLRFLKYDSSGRYVGEVGKDVFTDHVAPLSLYAAAGLDCLLLYEYLGDTLYRYDFESDEIKSLRFSDYGIDWEFVNLSILYDKQGNIYVCDRANPEMQPTDLYIINAQFTEIIGQREIPFWLALPLFIDDSGSLYLRGNPEGYSGEDSLYIMDPADNITELFSIRQYSQDSSEIYSGEDVLFVYGSSGCFYIGDSGVLIERIRGTSDSPVGNAITRNGNAYIKHKRYLSTDDKSPFRIYKVEVDWGQEVEKSLPMVEPILDLEAVGFA
ncbi:MAG: hypothetical protein SWK76_00330 [Actinomycetota bacterium]|nr:hypothetical protein [Actinomycetota bacterium]